MRPVSVLRSVGPWVMELYMWEDVPLGQSTYLYTLNPVFKTREERFLRKIKQALLLSGKHKLTSYNKGAAASGPSVT